MKVAKEDSRKELVKDIICGMVKPKSQMPFQSEYGGITYYFCTEMDKELFDAYPDRWVPKEEGPN